MVRNILFTAFLSALTAMTSASAVQANMQSACASRDRIVSKLEGSYGESRMGAGLRGQASLYELWASIESGTWTILVTDTEGRSCIMASGDNWQDIPAMPAMTGAPA